ncbi:MAG: hypothetical protein U5O39_04710 [Gammaproteobacteria bacterium]|nr:hypothetical protein [Gammaproteobacteria bacterium]
MKTLVVIRDPGTEEEEGWKPLVAGETRPCFSMTEPDNAGSEPTLDSDPRGAGR